MHTRTSPLLLVLLSVTVLAAQDPLGQVIIGPSTSQQFGQTVRIGADGTTLVVGVPGYDPDGNGLPDGRVSIYERSNGNWRIRPRFITQEGGAVCAQALDLTPDAETLVIGCFNPGPLGDFQGSVRTFNFENDRYEPLGDTLNGRAERDFFGRQVQLSGDGRRLAVLGSQVAGEGSNTLYLSVYELSEGKWQQIGQDITGPITTHFTLSADGNRLAYTVRTGPVAGAPNGTFAVVAREYADRQWAMIGDTLTAATPTDLFGSALDFARRGDLLLVASAPRNNAFGSEIGYLVAYDYREGDFLARPAPYFFPENKTSFGNYLDASADGRFLAAEILEFESIFERPVAAAVRFMELTETGLLASDQSLPFEPDRRPAFSASETGAYFAVGESFAVTVVNGNEFRGRVTVYAIDRTTGTAPPHPAQLPVRIYPNPAAAAGVNVELPTTFGGVKIVSLYTAAGRRLRRTTELATRFSFGTAALPAGLYYLEVTGARYYSRSKLIVP